MTVKPAAQMALGAVAGLSVVALASAARPSPAPASTLRPAMEANLSALVALQPLLSSPAAFSDPKNAATIASGLATLAQVKHQFPSGPGAPPAASIAGLFNAAVERARADFAAGRTDSARLRTHGLTALCLGCHARQVSAADFAAAGRVAEGMGLSPFERARFLAATRQFDAALALWGDAMMQPWKTEADAFAQAQALRAAMSVMVRAKDDPKGTVALLRSQWEREDLPPYLERAIAPWLRDAQAWEHEGFVASQKSGDALFERASSLIEASGAKDSLFPRESDRVLLLRATAYLSLALEKSPQAPWRGQALYELGLATAAVQDPDLWELDGVYLEACVRENPHTPLGRQCVDRLAERTLFEFTGSGGTRVPEDIAGKLEELRGLASLKPGG
jgi:hypothetical protein